jgi:hypothetical protein
MAIKFRQEITDWNTPNHIYIVENRMLIGYIQDGTTKPFYFKEPKKQWSATGRKFKDLTKKEIQQYV